jgi:hypothetical protein
LSGCRLTEFDGLAGAVVPAATAVSSEVIALQDPRLRGTAYRRRALRDACQSAWTECLG